MMRFSGHTRHLLRQREASTCRAARPARRRARARCRRQAGVPLSRLRRPRRRRACGHAGSGRADERGTRCAQVTLVLVDEFQDTDARSGRSSSGVRCDTDEESRNQNHFTVIREAGIHGRCFVKADETGEPRLFAVSPRRRDPATWSRRNKSLDYSYAELEQMDSRARERRTSGSVLRQRRTAASSMRRPQQEITASAAAKSRNTSRRKERPKPRRCSQNTVRGRAAAAVTRCSDANAPARKPRKAYTSQRAGPRRRMRRTLLRDDARCPRSLSRGVRAHSREERQREIKDGKARATRMPPLARKTSPLLRDARTAVSALERRDASCFEPTGGACARETSRACPGVPLLACRGQRRARQLFAAAGRQLSAAAGAVAPGESVVCARHWRHRLRFRRAALSALEDDGDALPRRPRPALEPARGAQGTQAMLPTVARNRRRGWCAAEANANHDLMNLGERAEARIGVQTPGASAARQIDGAVGDRACRYQRRNQCATGIRRRPRAITP